MSLNPLPKNPQALLNAPLLAGLLGELQGLKVTVIDGTAAGTAMAVAGIRDDDTIVEAIRFNDTWAPPTSDKANITIQSTTAAGTITVGTVPVADDTITVDDTVFTFKATPTNMKHIRIAANTTLQAAAIASTVNAYGNRYESQLNGDGNRTANVAVTSAGNVVTVKSLRAGAGNGIVLASSGATLTLAGSGGATGNITAASVVANNTVTINGVQFTAKATPAADTDFAVKAGDTAQAAELVRAIKAYAYKTGALNLNVSNTGATVILTNKDPKFGNLITIAKTGSAVTVSGATLAGGSNNGSIKSTSDLSAATLVLIWFDKRV